MARSLFMPVRQGDSIACVFGHPESRIILSAHSDDFTVLVRSVTLSGSLSSCVKKGVNKSAHLGAGPNGDEEAGLNHIIRWTSVFLSTKPTDVRLNR